MSRRIVYALASTRHSPDHPRTVMIDGRELPLEDDGEVETISLRERAAARHVVEASEDEPGEWHDGTVRARLSASRKAFAAALANAGEAESDDDD